MNAMTVSMVLLWIVNIVVVVTVLALARQVAYCSSASRR